MQRIRRSVKRKIGIVFCSSVLSGTLFFVGCVLSRDRVQIKYSALLDEQEQFLNSLCRTAYVTVTELKAGEVFTEENTVKKAVFTETPSDALSDEVLGFLSSSDLPAGTILSPALCVKPEENSLRECAYRKIAGTEIFPEFSFVDIRIRYPNGENCSIVQKKQLLLSDEDETLSRFYLNEKEQLLMSAALYDAEVYKGASVFLVKYREEKLKKEEETRFSPSLPILQELYAKGLLSEQETELFTEMRKRMELRQREDREKRQEEY